MFDTVNASNNTGAGWFVDDFEVSDLLVAGLHQYPAGSPTPVPVGEGTTSFDLEFRAAVSGAASGGVQLDVEVQPLGTSFTGTPTASATGTGAGTILSVTVTVPALGGYHWQARTVDLVSSAVSAWMSFGLNAETDADLYVVLPPPPGGSGGGHHGGCGLSGPEALSALVLVALARRLRPRRRT
jgi:hypothetical protein